MGPDGGFISGQAHSGHIRAVALRQTAESTWTRNPSTHFVSDIAMPDEDVTLLRDASVPATMKIHHSHGGREPRTAAGYNISWRCPRASKTTFKKPFAPQDLVRAVAGVLANHR